MGTVKGAQVSPEEWCGGETWAGTRTPVEGRTRYYDHFKPLFVFFGLLELVFFYFILIVLNDL
jgi:hypothetical protein